MGRVSKKRKTMLRGDAVEATVGRALRNEEVNSKGHLTVDENFIGAWGIEFSDGSGFLGGLQTLPEGGFERLFRLRNSDGTKKWWSVTRKPGTMPHESVETVIAEIRDFMQKFPSPEDATVVSTFEYLHDGDSESFMKFAEEQGWETHYVN